MIGAITGKGNDSAPKKLLAFNGEVLQIYLDT